MTTFMAFPIQVSFRNLAVSDAAESRCWQEAARLTDACDRISNCRVMIETRRNGTPDTDHCVVRVDLTIPGQRLITAEADHIVPCSECESAICETICDAFGAALARIRERLG